MDAGYEKEGDTIHRVQGRDGPSSEERKKAAAALPENAQPFLNNSLNTSGFVRDADLETSQNFDLSPTVPPGSKTHGLEMANYRTKSDHGLQRVNTGQLDRPHAADDSLTQFSKLQIAKSSSDINIPRQASQLVKKQPTLMEGDEQQIQKERSTIFWFMQQVKEFRIQNVGQPVEETAVRFLAHPAEKRFHKPKFVKDEKQILSKLSLLQKLAIIIFNLLEPVLIWGLMMTSVLTPGYLNLVYFAFGMLLLYMMTDRYIKEDPSSRSPNARVANRGLLWRKTKILLLLMACIVAIISFKLVLMFNGMAPAKLKPTDVTKLVSMERLGMVYQDASGEVLTLSKSRSLVPETDALVIVLAFFCYNRMVYHALLEFNRWENKKDQQKIYSPPKFRTFFVRRKLTRFLPKLTARTDFNKKRKVQSNLGLMRQGTIRDESRHSDFNAASNQFARPLQRENSIDSASQMGRTRRDEILESKQGQVKNQVYDEIVEKNYYEFILEHPWLVENISSCFYFISFLIALDTAFFQSLISLLFYIFLIIFYAFWVVQKGSFRPQVVTLRVQRLLSTIKWILILQLLCIFFFSTQRFAFTESGHLSKFYQLMGFIQFYDPDLWKNPEEQSVYLGKNTHLLYHVIEGTFIVCFIVFQKKSFYIIKRPAPKVEDHMRAESAASELRSPISRPLDAPSQMSQDRRFRKTNNVIATLYSSTSSNFYPEMEMESEGLLGTNIQLSKLAVPFLLLWLVRINVCVFAYMYHDWEALLPLMWIGHSFLTFSVFQFRKPSFIFYMPVIFLIVLFYFLLNINYVFTEIFNKEHGEVGHKKTVYGLIEYQYQIVEVLFSHFLIYSFVLWLKSGENLTVEQDDFQMQAVGFIRTLSRPESSTFENLLLLSIPYIEQVFLVLVALSGLNKMDVYHVLFLFYFVAYLLKEKMKQSLTYWLIIYGYSFIILKYIFSLLLITMDDIDQNTQDILDFIGIGTDFDPSKDFKLFEYQFWPQQWGIVVVSYLFYWVLRLLEEKEEFEQASERAIKNLKKNNPFLNRVWTNMYFLKLDFMLVIVFVAFELIIQVVRRSLIFWGYQLLTNLLIYMEVSFANKGKRSKKRKYWRVITWYSGIIMLINIVILLLQQPLIRKTPFYQWLLTIIPDWIEDAYANDIFGFVSQDDIDQHKGPSLYVQYLPHLTFFILSIYGEAQISEWELKDANAFNDLAQLYQKKDQMEPLMASVDMASVEDLRKQAQAKRDEHAKVSEIQTVIKFSGRYLGYRLRRRQRLMDILGMYFHLAVYFTVAILTLFWWFNLINLLQIASLILFNLSIGRLILKMSKKQRKQFFASEEGLSSIRKTSSQQKVEICEDTVTEQKTELDDNIRAMVLKKRLITFAFQYFIITVALVLIYPSEFLQQFEQIADKHTTTVGPIIKRTRYLMFISGVLHDHDAEGNHNVSFFYQTWGYLLIFVLCLIDRVLLQWLEDRFGFSEHVHEMIKFLKSHEASLSSQIEAIEAKVKRAENMRPLAGKMNRGLIQSIREMSQAEEEEDESMVRLGSSVNKSQLQIPDEIQKKQIEEDLASTKASLLEKLLVSPRLQIRRGFRSLLEDLVILMIWTSAILKMNLQSFIDLFLILNFILFRTPRTMNRIMNIVSIVYLVRLFIILSNMYENLQPMIYPDDFKSGVIYNPADQPEERYGNQLFIPWLQRVVFAKEGKQQSEMQHEITWAYWGMLFTSKQKLPILIVDFITMSLLYVYYVGFLYWLLLKDARIILSKSTEGLIIEYKMQRRNLQILENKMFVDKADSHLKSKGKFIENLQPLLPHPEIHIDAQADAESQRRASQQQIKGIIESVLKTSSVYTFYLEMQRFLNVYYSKLMVAMIIILSILSNSIFSLGYVIILCILMFYNEVFLNVSQARTTLLFILKQVMIPYMLVEIVLQLVYQIPAVNQLNIDNSFIANLPSYLGIENFYQVTVSAMNSLNDLTFSKSTSLTTLGQLWCKALVFFLINVEVQIITSSSFERLRDVLSLSKEKGQAITYLFNNYKIKKYIEYQEKNYKKEKMIESIKKKTQFWQGLFDKEKEATHLSQYDLNASMARLKEDQARTPLLKSRPPLVVEVPEPKSAIVPFNKKSSVMSHEPIKEEEFEDEETTKLNLSKAESDWEKVDASKNDSTIRFSQELRGVNAEYLAVRKFTQRKSLLDRHTQQSEDIFSGDALEMNDEDHKDLHRELRFDTLFQSSEFYSKFRERVDNLPGYVRFYIYLRVTLLSPIMLIYEKEKIRRLKREAKMGEIKVRSSIEMAIMQDIYMEILTGQEENLETSKKLRPFKLFLKYLNLFQQVFIINLTTLAYIFMVIQAIMKPGVCTVIYPLAIFGYALLQETRPPKQFWYFVLFYTQTLMVIEFFMSMTLVSQTEINKNCQEFFVKYHIGIEAALPYGWTNTNVVSRLFVHFLPKILLLFTVMNLMQAEVMLGLFDKKEDQLESMEKAYIRFIKGQFQIEISDQVENYNRDRWEIKQEFTILVNQYLGQLSSDDFWLVFETLSPKQDEYEREAELVQQQMQAQHPYHSDTEILLKDDLEERAVQRRDTITERRKKKQKGGFMKKLQRGLLQLTVKKGFIRSLFPELKIQKPGQDYYSAMLSVQVILCVYIIILYSKMQHPSGKNSDSSVTILDMINSNSFDGTMLIVLTVQVVIMILDRYIYKSKSFVEKKKWKKSKQQVDRIFSQIEESEGKKKDIDWNRIATQSTQNFNEIVKQQQVFNDAQNLNKQDSIVEPSPSQSRSLGFSVVSFSSLQTVAQNEENLQKVKVNVEQLLAKTKVSFRDVMKFYFQWIVLLLIHLQLFFILPIKGNRLSTANNNGYCDEGDIIQDNCNDLNRNPYLWMFYVLYCFYFYFSAIQIKKGLPELMQTYFMMGNYSKYNRWIFTGFLQIPFLFELRVFIDWTYTKTSLDVFQWIKASQIQNDLYKAKSTNKGYFDKKLGKPIASFDKCTMGLGAIILIIALLIGPMFLFSTAFSFGSINPISRTEMSLKFKIDQADEQSEPLLMEQDFFASQSIYKLANVSKDWYQEMGFNNPKVSSQTAQYPPEEFQYLILNDMQISWINMKAQKSRAVAYLKKILDEAPKTQGSVTFTLYQQFTRQYPSYALNPARSQSFILDASTDKIAIQSFEDALNHECKTGEDSYVKEIPLAGSNNNQLMDAVVFLSLSNSALGLQSHDPNTVWSKQISVSYNCTDGSEHWQVAQQNLKGLPEEPIYDSYTSHSSVEGYLSFFILSRKVIKGFNYSVIAIYATIVYAASKLFRSVMVPETSKIPITDAKDPEDLLMLCETINLYRLKQMSTEEEKLYFLLIDIMRSPVIFKAICKDSLKHEAPIKREVTFEGDRSTRSKSVKSSTLRKRKFTRVNSETSLNSSEKQVEEEKREKQD